MRPLAVSILIASRTTPRLAPKRTSSSCSGGSASPGGKTPRTMSDPSPDTTAPIFPGLMPCCIVTLEFSVLKVGLLWILSATDGLSESGLRPDNFLCLGDDVLSVLLRHDHDPIPFGQDVISGVYDDIANGHRFVECFRDPACHNVQQRREAAEDRVAFRFDKALSRQPPSTMSPRTPRTFSVSAESSPIRARTSSWG